MYVVFGPHAYIDGGVFDGGNIAFDYMNRAGHFLYRLFIPERIQRGVLLFCSVVVTRRGLFFMPNLNGEPEIKSIDKLKQPPLRIEAAVFKIQVIVILFST